MILSVDGKVALVTGAGRGLGCPHTLLLAARGAAVVVNDLGASSPEEGVDSSPATQVADEIIAAGGRAVANHDDVTTDAPTIAQTAVDHFGRLDTVINNAGINQATAFGPDAVESITRHIEANFNGTVAVTAAACPHLIEAGAGRVVNTASPTIVGFEGQTPYVASKGALFAFTRTLAMNAEHLGIRVNAIAPTAFTRMAAEAEPPDEFKEMLKSKVTTDIASPMVANLAHESCQITGETLLTQGGVMQRIILAVNDGCTNAEVTSEGIRDNLETILDDSTNSPLGRIGSADEGSLVDMFD